MIIIIVLLVTFVVAMINDSSFSCKNTCSNHFESNQLNQKANLYARICSKIFVAFNKQIRKTTSKPS